MKLSLPSLLIAAVAACAAAVAGGASRELVKPWAEDLHGSLKNRPQPPAADRGNSKPSH